MPYNQRKQLRGRHGYQKNLGTVQVTVQLPEKEKFQPGSTLPIDVEIRRSCRQNCAFDEIKVRLHEVLSYTTPHHLVVTESTRIVNKKIKTNQKRKTKSGVINLKQTPLEVPELTRRDGKLDGVRVRHVLEIKLISRGMSVDNVSFKFPINIGGTQRYKVMPDNHLCYQKTQTSKHSMRNLLAKAESASFTDASSSVRGSDAGSCTKSQVTL